MLESNRSTKNLLKTHSESAKILNFISKSRITKNSKFIIRRRLLLSMDFESPAEKLNLSKVERKTDKNKMTLNPNGKLQ